MTTKWATMTCDCCSKRPAVYFENRIGKPDQGNESKTGMIKCDKCRAHCKNMVNGVCNVNY